jgi:hypothetical protein
MHRVSSLTITGRAVRDAPLARMIIELLDMRED